MSVTKQHRKAVHEAAHALCGIHLGYQVRHITIEPNGKREAHVCFLPPSGEWPVQHRAGMLLAGGIAELKLDPSCTPGDVRDKEKVAALDEANGNLRGIWMARELAQRIVTDRWPQITGVALALLAWRTMPGDAVAVIMKACR